MLLQRTALAGQLAGSKPVVAPRSSTPCTAGVRFGSARRHAIRRAVNSRSIVRSQAAATTVVAEAPPVTTAVENGAPTQAPAAPPSEPVATFELHEVLATPFWDSEVDGVSFETSNKALYLKVRENVPGIRVWRSPLGVTEVAGESYKLEDGDMVKFPTGRKCLVTIATAKDLGGPTADDVTDDRSARLLAQADDIYFELHTVSEAFCDVKLAEVNINRCEDGALHLTVSPTCPDVAVWRKSNGRRRIKGMTYTLEDGDVVHFPDGRNCLVMFAQKRPSIVADPETADAPEAIEPANAASPPVAVAAEAAEVAEPASAAPGAAPAPSASPALPKVAPVHAPGTPSLFAVSDTPFWKPQVRGVSITCSASKLLLIVEPQVAGVVVWRKGAGLMGITGVLGLGFELENGDIITFPNEGACLVLATTAGELEQLGLEGENGAEPTWRAQPTDVFYELRDIIFDPLEPALTVGQSVEVWRKENGLSELSWEEFEVTDGDIVCFQDGTLAVAAVA